MMDYYVEIFLSAAVMLGGVLLGLKLSRTKKWWYAGYMISMAVIMAFAAGRYSEGFFYSEWAEKIRFHRYGFVILCSAIGLGISSVLRRLPGRFDKIAVCLIMTAVVTWFGVLPVMMPAVLQNRLMNLKSTVDLEGNCYQSTDYTCGPAAAVTALGRFGIKAQEGEVAAACRSNPITGTSAGSLCAVLKNKYQNRGIECKYRHFSSIDELKGDVVTLAMVRDTLLTDHCVAVLDVSDGKITVADPVMGRIRMTAAQFAKIWRFRGISIKRPLGEKAG